MFTPATHYTDNLSYNEYDFGVDCNSGQYYFFFTLAVVMCCVYSLGIPSFFLYLLVKNRNVLQTTDGEVTFEDFVAIETGAKDKDGQLMDRENLQQWFNAIDTNGSGTLSTKEFAEYTLVQNLHEGNLDTQKINKHFNGKSAKNAKSAEDKLPACSRWCGRQKRELQANPEQKLGSRPGVQQSQTSLGLRLSNKSEPDHKAMWSTEWWRASKDQLKFLVNDYEGEYLLRPINMSFRFRYLPLILGLLMTYSFLPE